MGISNLNEIIKNKNISFKDYSNSKKKSVLINEGLKNNYPLCVTEFVCDPSINNQKLDILNLTKTSSQNEEISIESNISFKLGFKKLCEISNQCILKMKHIKRDEEDYDTFIKILITFIQKQKVTKLIFRTIILQF